MPKLRVFVSHVSIEAKFADLLRKRMRRDFIGLLDFFVSTDSTSIPVGTQWFDEVVNALQRAEVLFIFCSDYSVRMPWIQYEAGGARVREVTIIPICHSGMTPATLPVPLSMTEGITLTNAGGLEKLYSVISTRLQCDVPVVDFDAYSREFRELEVQYERQRRNDEVAQRSESHERLVENPRVVCVSSQQYLDLGFQNQLQVVLDAFPTDLRHERVITSRDVTRVLLAGPWDIVHIAAYVCPRVGDLYFSAVDRSTGRRDPENVDFIPAAALAQLLSKARTRLVVIASHDSLALATDLLPVTNVIAPNGIVSAGAMAVWVDTFYGVLSQTSLAEAFELAAMKSRAPMKLLAQQAKPPDLVFAGQGAAADERP